MIALVLEEYRQLRVQAVETPVPRDTEVLIRVESVGICGSDIHGYDGSTGRRVPPIIMGHEAAGTIAAVGQAVSGWSEGDRVTFDSTLYRLDDWYSRRGWYNLSDGRRVLGVSCDEYRQPGAFAEYVAVPAHVLYRLPDALSMDHAALTEPVAVALHGIALTPVAFGDTVAVLGAGVIGLATVAGLRRRGCVNIVVSDMVASRLEVARAMGATHTVNPASGESLLQTCRALTDGRGADAVIEAVGIQATISESIAAVRRGGTVTILGNLTPEITIPLQRVVAGQIRIQGSCAICNEYPAALGMLADGAIPADRLITAVAPLEEGPALFERLYEGSTDHLKVVLKP